MIECSFELLGFKYFKLYIDKTGPSQIKYVFALF